jgi:hypothetical protein
MESVVDGLYDLIDYVIEEDYMDGACSAHGRDEKCVKNFGWEV